MKLNYSFCVTVFNWTTLSHQTNSCFCAFVHVFIFFFKCNFKHIPLTSDNVSNVLYNEAHFYCSSSESSERELCGKPGKTHSHSCCGTIDPDLCPDRLTRNQESKPSSNYKIARAIILFLFLTKRITAEVQVTVYCLWYLAFQKETIPLSLQTIV